MKRLCGVLLVFVFNRANCNEFYSSDIYPLDKYDRIDDSNYPDLLEEESQQHLDYEEPITDDSYDDDVEDEKAEERTFQKHSDCVIKYETVSVVKQVPSFSKHCHKVEDTKCKTIFKNSFATKLETQCIAAFETRNSENLFKTSNNYEERQSSIIRIFLFL